MIFLHIILGLSLLGMAWCAVMLVRNQAVFKFRSQLADLVHYACGVDIKNDRDWEWRYHVLTSVSYQSMVAKFWKPLRVANFYKDSSFINAGAKQPKSKISMVKVRNAR